MSLDWSTAALTLCAAIAAAAAGAAILGGLTAEAVSAVPADDRRYRDRPPPAFNASWWLVRIIAHYLERRIPRKWHGAAAQRLVKAGLDYSLSVEQFVAFQLVAGAFAAALMSFVAKATVICMAMALAAGALLPEVWLRDRIQARRRQTQKTLPFVLDLITLCVEAGLTLQAALMQATEKGPAGPLRDELLRVLRDHRAGRTRAESLRDLAARMSDPAVSNFVSALLQSEAMGSNLGPILRAQAEQRRTERFARAEKLAMEAPVKMLFPLIAFIFPCTFLVLGFPIAMKFLRLGL